MQTIRQGNDDGSSAATPTAGLWGLSGATLQSGTDTSVHSQLLPDWLNSQPRGSSSETLKPVFDSHFTKHPQFL